MAWNEYLEETKTFVGLYTGFWSMVFCFVFKKNKQKKRLVRCSGAPPTRSRPT